jgi:hypothetical protein
MHLVDAVQDERTNVYAALHILTYTRSKTLHDRTLTLHFQFYTPHIPMLAIKCYQSLPDTIKAPFIMEHEKAAVLVW